MAIFDFMFTAATGSSVAKIHRRSLALYGPTERAFIENNVYNVQYPKILILEGMSWNSSSLLYFFLSLLPHTSYFVSERSCLFWLVHSGA